MTRNSDYPVGTELVSPHGNHWVKTGPNEWRVRASSGMFDMRSVYSDTEVLGTPLRVPTLAQGRR